MKKAKNNKVIYIRSTSIINDSRASKEITSLMNNGYDVLVLGWDRDNRISDYDSVYINNQKIKTVFFKYKAHYGKSYSTIKGLILFQFWLKKQLKKYSNTYDYIHACDFDCGYIACKAKRKYHKKLIYDMYDYYTDSRPMPKFLRNIIEKKENRIIDFADVSIICGEWREKQIQKAHPKRLIVIHNTPSLTYIEKEKIIKSNSNKIKVAYVGVFQENRLLLELLDEFKRNQDYELHIGGFGIYENEIKKASENYDNIYYYGSLKYDQVLSLEHDCDLLFATYNPIVQNHKFSAPNKVYEAMALGKSIIVCKNTGIDELVVSNNLGSAINYDAKEFIKVLYNYSKNKKQLEVISDNAKKLYQKKYNWNLMEKILIDSYKNISNEVNYEKKSKK